LQPDLPDFLARLKDLGLAVKLDTNGSQPDVLAALLRRRLVDFVAMDVKAPWDRYHALAGGPCDLAALRRSVALLASAGVPHEFRTTRVDPLLTDDDLGRLRAQVPAGSPHRWQTFRPEHSLAPSLRPAVPAAGGETNAKQHTAMALPSRQV
jgi:pyruvate formate lyase activating enzyme